MKSNKRDRLSWFPFYPTDFFFDLDVVKMTTEEIGQYLILLSLVWMERGIKRDADLDLRDTLSTAIAALKPASRLSERVVRMFYERDGRIYQKRIEEELNEALANINQKKEAGKRGAEVRYNKQFTKQGSDPIAEPCERDNAAIAKSSTPIALTSPYHTIKKKTPPVCPPVIYNRDSGRFENITEEQIARWKEAFPAVDIPQAIKAMEVYWKANPAKAVKSNWARAIVNWLKKDQDRGGSVPSVKPASSGYQVSQVGRWEKPTAEEEAEEKRLRELYTADAEAYAKANGYASVDDIPFDEIEPFDDWKRRKKSEEGGI